MGKYMCTHRCVFKTKVDTMDLCFGLWYIVAFTFLPMYIIYVLLLPEFDRHDYSQFRVHRAALKLLYRTFQHFKQGQLYIPNGLSYTAGGGVDSNCSLIISPTKHKIIFKEVRIDLANLRRYKALCCDGSSAGEVPVCYAETLFLKPLLALITSSKFCVSPIGLIHIRQTIKQWFPLQDYISSTFTAEVSVVEYRKFDRGIEVDVSLRLLVSGNMCVWEGVATFLSRASGAPKSARKYKDQEQPYPNNTSIAVPGSCGTQYARISGDWNPHHLYPWTAKLLGYRRQIAHGMWTLSRAISELHISASDLSGTLVEISCSFKTPLFMPGTVRVRSDQLVNAHQNTGCRFLVEHPESGAPHVVGRVKLI